MTMVNDFFNLLPKEVQKLILTINQMGFKFGLIGGCVRDFLLYNKISDDFDCELRPLNPLKIDSQWHKLINSLKNEYKLTLLPYNVLRISLNDLEVELTYPRLEIFNKKSGHSNFEVTHIPDTDYSNGFKRRDFTINSILFEKYFDNEKVIDPLNGLKHIRESLLVKCSEDFEKDPVRFLRAYRFKNKLQFEFDKDLISTLSTQNIDGLTNYYIKKELSKSSNPILMFYNILNSRKEFLNLDTEFVKNETHVKNIANFFEDNLDGFILTICFSVMLNDSVRKHLFDRLNISHKKSPLIKRIDYKELQLNKLKTITAFCESSIFKTFCNWSLDILKYSDKICNELLIDIFKFSNLKISPNQFKAIFISENKLTNDIKTLVSKENYKYAMMAKKVIEVCK